MDNKYFYLDGKEQKGPFSIEQIKNVGLKPDTLVWIDGFDSWKPAKETAELNGLIIKTPPPLPVVKIIPDSMIQPPQKNHEMKNVFVEDSNVKFWISLKIFGAFFLIIGLAVFSAYLFLNNKKQKLKMEINAKIENIMGGKTVILDGTNVLTEGKLEEGYSDPLLTFPNRQEQWWWNRAKLYTIYLASSGGFTVEELTRIDDDAFHRIAYYSGDMGYKTPVQRYVEPVYIDSPIFGRYKINDGYYANNYRLPVRECYREAFEYFTKDDRHSPGAYSPGKYVDISNFSFIRNEYFYMDNYLSGLRERDEHNTNINTENWVVFYNTQHNYYKLTENEPAIRKDFFTYSGIFVCPIFLFFLILFFSKPNYFKNLSLYGKRWKNTSCQEQIFFFEHSFFGKHIFVEIINDKIFKGVLKFTDKGNTINLSYPNKELFYKIEKINQDDLDLISITDYNNITFRRVGAKAIDETPKEY